MVKLLWPAGAGFDEAFPGAPIGGLPWLSLASLLAVQHWVTGKEAGYGDFKLLASGWAPGWVWTLFAGGYSSLSSLLWAQPLVIRP